MLNRCSRRRRSLLPRCSRRRRSSLPQRRRSVLPANVGGLRTEGPQLRRHRFMLRIRLPSAVQQRFHCIGVQTSIISGPESSMQISYPHSGDHSPVRSLHMVSHARRTHAPCRVCDRWDVQTEVQTRECQSAPLPPPEPSLLSPGAVDGAGPRPVAGPLPSKSRFMPLAPSRRRSPCPQTRTAAAAAFLVGCPSPTSPRCRVPCRR